MSILKYTGKLKLALNERSELSLTPFVIFLIANSSSLMLILFSITEIRLHGNKNADVVSN